jgi:hypothetical protein
MKAKENVRYAAMLLFYILNKYRNKSCTFFSDLLNAQFRDPFAIKWRQFTPTSQVRATANFLISDCGKLKKKY